MHRPKINGKNVIRPPRNHPNPAHWDRVRMAALERDGHACRACPNDTTSGVALEIHHRHYDNWGREELDDVVTLCVLCHDAITDRIRVTTEYPVAPADPMPRAERPTIALKPVSVEGEAEKRDRPDRPSIRTQTVSVDPAPRAGPPPRDKPKR